jgi:hypothetical protein
MSLEEDLITKGDLFREIAKLKEKIKEKVMEVRLSIGRTINLGNYESLRVEVSAERTFPDEDLVRGVIDRLRLDVGDSLDQVIKDEELALKRSRRS